MSSLIPLSCLTPGKSNPRKTRPAQEAHHRLVASITAHGLIHPLVVRPADGKDKKFTVIAGNRRLSALREIHRGDSDVKVACVVRKIDPITAAAMSLGENFAREAMHPLDEAEAFARLARQDGKDAESIAADFGVSVNYVKQRSRLADLARPIGDAYRSNAIDTATAEAFASVPKDQQLKIWKELDGRPTSAHHVKQVIAGAWISAKSAMFDVSTLPPEAVSADLFSEDVLVEREVFLQLQRQAVDLRRQVLLEEGWAEVVIADRDQVRDRLWSMDEPQPQFDPPVQKKLTALARQQKKLEKRARRLKFGAKREAVLGRVEAIEQQAGQIVEAAPAHYDQQAMAKGIVFLILGPDGSVRQEHRIPRPRPAHAGESNGDGKTDSKLLDSNQLSDGQTAFVLAHQAVAVREALHRKPHLRNVVLAMVLHEKVRSDALAIRHDPNDSTLHADHHQQFSSKPKDHLAKLRSDLDPLASMPMASDLDAFEKLNALSDAKLGDLIAILAVELLTNRMQRSNDLVLRLAGELEVRLREHWTPDSAWLKSYRKIQLTELLTKFNGAIGALAPDTKHSVLVDRLADLFAGAAQGTLADKKLAEKVNRWVPATIASAEKSKPAD